MNENVMLLHDNHVDRAVIAASSEVAAMPVSNLQDHQRTEMWRTLAAGVQTIDITRDPSEEPVEAFALVDHNLSIAGTVQLQAWDDAIDGAVETLNITLEPYQPTYGYGELGFGDGLYGGYDIYINGLSIGDARSVIRPILTAVIEPVITSRYWRITLSDAGQLNYYQAGRLYLGSFWQPEDNFSWGSTKKRHSRALRKESRGGQYYGNPRPGRTELNFSLDWLNDADRYRLWIIYMLLGDSSPFILIQQPIGGYEQESSTLYGVFDALSIEQAFHNNSKAPVVFMESL